MKKLLAITALASLLLIAAPCRAMDTAYTRQTLRGLPGVYVLVENLDDDAKQIGLRLDQIQTDAELKLRLAGIRLLTLEESHSTLGALTLYINVNVIPSKTSRYGFSVRFELTQLVQVIATKIPTVAATWSTDYVGIGSTDGALSFIRQSLNDHLDVFLNAWLSVNPKK